MRERNPYDVCTWRPLPACGGCPLAEKLKCRFDQLDLLRFLFLFCLFAIPAAIGVFRSGYGWSLLGWILFGLFFFEVWEIRILCSHCPYYAERSRTLRCIANYGSLKLWRYHPEPMSRSERFQLIAGFTILFGFPFPFMVLGGTYGWAAVALGGLLLFIVTLLRLNCSRCVNFSCPLNRVPQDLVDAYLDRNPVIKEAWHRSGRP